MENWKEKINKGDITNAARAAKCAREVYHQSLNVDPENWTSKMIDVNYELKKIVVDREERRAGFLNKSKTC